MAKASEKTFLGIDSVEKVKNGQKQVMDLLQEAEELSVEIASKAVRLEDIKTILLNVQNENEMNGIRHNNFAYVASFQDGKRTLNKEMLIENGCDPDIISNSYKTGDGFWKREFKSV